MNADSKDRKASPDGDRRLEDYANEQQTGIVREFIDFLLHNKKWWLSPIILVLFLLGLLVVLSGSGAAPWIYSLF